MDDHDGTPAPNEPASRSFHSTRRGRDDSARVAAPAARLAAFGFVLLVAAIAWPTPGRAGCQVETVELPVRMVGSRAVATVGINGTSVPLMVDSGAFFSMLTDAAAAQLKLSLRREPALKARGLIGAIDAQVTTVDKLKLFKGDIDQVDFVVGGNEVGAGTLGLLGRNVLSFTDVEYDLAHGAIRFHFPNDECRKSSMAYWAGDTPVTEVELIDDYRSRLPALRADVKLNGKDFVALFDTGATTMVSASAAAKAGVAEADLKPAGIVYGAGRGSVRAWTAPFAKFEIGGEAISNNRLGVADFKIPTADLLLGVDFFLSHRIYVSKQQSRMFITYNGGPVFALDWTDTTRTAASATDPTIAEVGALTADQLMRRGAASAARGDYAGALADLDRACALEPTAAASFAQRGGVQVALKHADLAIADFDRALALDPTQVDALYGRAALRFRAKDRDGAKADLDALDRTLAPQAQMRLAMSQFYLALDQPAQTIAQLDQWLPAHRKEIARDVALNRRCWARMTLGVELEQALGDCDDAITAAPKNAIYLQNRGWLYVKLGRFDKARSDFDRSVEYRPANAYALYGRGLTKGRLGDTTGGDADLAAAREIQADIDAKVAAIGLTTGQAAGH